MATRTLIEALRDMWESLFRPNVGRCTHPIQRLRFDGFWDWHEPPTASVSCTRCEGSFSVPLRQDVAARVRAEYVARTELIHVGRVRANASGRIRGA